MSTDKDMALTYGESSCGLEVVKPMKIPVHRYHILFPFPGGHIYGDVTNLV